MKIAIVGSRDFPTREEVNDYLEKQLYNLKEFEIITGGARGVDTFAISWCKMEGINCEVIRPINPKDKISYLFRNIEIITKADIVVAFWDGKSKGTKFVIDYCRKRDKTLFVKESTRKEVHEE